MNHTYKILKYLYLNNDGEYHNVKGAYKEKELPSVELLFYKIRELEKYQFIISKSVYEERGILSTGFTAEELLGNPPGNLDFNFCGFQLMITTNGEEYIDNKTINITKNWIVEKRSFWITFIGIIVAIVTLLVNLIFC